MKKVTSFIILCLLCLSLIPSTKLKTFLGFAQDEALECTFDADCGEGFFCNEGVCDVDPSATFRDQVFPGSSPTSQICGNGIVEGTEACDGSGCGAWFQCIGCVCVPSTPTPTPTATPGCSITVCPPNQVLIMPGMPGCFCSPTSTPTATPGCSITVCPPNEVLIMPGMPGCFCSPTASPSPSTSPPAVCGNGIVETDEVCDDGNTNDGDGCNSSCCSVCEECMCTTCYVEESPAPLARMSFDDVKAKSSREKAVKEHTELLKKAHVDWGNIKVAARQESLKNIFADVSGQNGNTFVKINNKNRKYNKLNGNNKGSYDEVSSTLFGKDGSYITRFPFTKKILKTTCLVGMDCMSAADCGSCSDCVNKKCQLKKTASCSTEGGFTCKAPSVCNADCDCSTSCSATGTCPNSCLECTGADPNKQCTLRPGAGCTADDDCSVRTRSDSPGHKCFSCICGCGGTTPCTACETCNNMGTARCVLEAGMCNTNADCPSNQECSGCSCVTKSCPGSAPLCNGTCPPIAGTTQKCLGSAPGGVSTCECTSCVCMTGDTKCDGGKVIGCANDCTWDTTAVDCPAGQSCKTNKCEAVNCGDPGNDKEGGTCFDVGCDKTINQTCVATLVGCACCNCNVAGQKKCINAGQYVVCDGCNWGTAKNCSATQRCASGVCMAAPTPTPTPTPTIYTCSTKSPIFVPSPSPGGWKCNPGTCPPGKSCGVVVSGTTRSCGCN